MTSGQGYVAGRPDWPGHILVCRGSIGRGSPHLGSAPGPSMQFVMALACRYQRLLPAEALNASTINAAHAIGLGNRVGSLEVGKQADLLILKTPDYRHLAYQFGGNLVERVIKKGQIVPV